MTAFIASRQRSTLGLLPEAILHPAAPLIQEYVEKGILVHTGPAWPQKALDCAMAKGPHALAYTPEMTAFIRGELHQHVPDGFSILLPVADVVRLFGDNLKLSRITAVPQEH